jgi:signal recognition particle receptor subunit beta
MAHVDSERRELALTLLLVGPVRAGKQSVLAAIRDRVSAARRAGGTTVAPGLLAWLPLELGQVGGWEVRLRLYALPEGGPHHATRHLLLAEADGLLLVLDGQATRLEDNLAVLRRLEEDRTDRAGARRDLATVMLYTKQDLPPELLLPRSGLEAALNRQGAPSWGGDIPHGTGVLEALHALVTLALRRHAPPKVGP